MDQMISGEDFERTIQNFDNNFSLHLMDLLEKLSHYSTIDCEHQMLNIIARLDHNGFYTAQLEKKAAAQGENISCGCDWYLICALGLELKLVFGDCQFSLSLYSLAQTVGRRDSLVTASLKFCD